MSAHERGLYEMLITQALAGVRARGHATWAARRCWTRTVLLGKLAAGFDRPCERVSEWRIVSRTFALEDRLGQANAIVSRWTRPGIPTLRLGRGKRVARLASLFYTRSRVRESPQPAKEDGRKPHDRDDAPIPVRHRDASLTAVALTALGCSRQTAEGAEEARAIAERVGRAHGLDAWRDKEVAQADVSVVLGGEPFVDARFWFEVRGPRVRMEKADGRTVVHDGEDAYLLEGSQAEPVDRSHVLAWPFFIRGPLQASSEHSRLSDPRTIELEGVEYRAVYQTFHDGQGDTPDDWWRYFVDPETDRVDYASYVVTFGKTVEEANENPRLVDYSDFETVGGVTLATKYEFYRWDAEAKRIADEDPLGSGTVENLRFLSAEEVDFRVPENAVRIPMPSR